MNIKGHRITGMLENSRGCSKTEVLENGIFASNEVLEIYDAAWGTKILGNYKSSQIMEELIITIFH